MLRALCVVGAEDRAREELCRTAYRGSKRILDTWDLRLTRLAHNLQRSISNAYEPCHADRVGAQRPSRGIDAQKLSDVERSLIAQVLRFPSLRKPERLQGRKL